jgi:uncharacterized phage-associated protein
MMKPSYREEKTTQAACYFLKERGGRMSYMKLIKLLYLADRAALLKWGRPISFDAYFSLDHGPVLSKTYDLLTEGVPPGAESYWHSYISDPENYEVSLREADCPTEELSDAERGVLEAVWRRFGGMSRWELRDWMHANVPEWTDPMGTAIPIAYRDILVRSGKTELEAAEIEEEIDSLAVAEAVFG